MDNYGISDFIPQNHMQDVAQKIAIKLNDLDNLKFHLKAVYTIGPNRAQYWCDYVCEVPQQKIKKSRAAYYVSMVRREMALSKQTSPESLTKLQELKDQLVKHKGM